MPDLEPPFRKVWLRAWIIQYVPKLFKCKFATKLSHSLVAQNTIAIGYIQFMHG